MPQGGLAQVLRNLPRVDDPNVLVGTDTYDDAGVYKLTDEIALVQTMDFFPPVLDDPFVYGQIAAANALSDVYAMGGVPKTALNLVGYPDDKDPELTWLGEIMRGGAERCVAAGVAVVGGHTVRDAEIKFGLSVTGIVHPQKVLTNANAKPGDKLVLTKPLGTGFLTTAHKRRECPEELFKTACESMVQLNKVGADAMADFDVHAVTDVTGFGLAGHGYEMAKGSGVTLVFYLSRLPIFPGAENFAKKPFLTRASNTNASHVGGELRRDGEMDPVRMAFLFDPQTSGGLLISLPEEQAESLVDKVKANGATAACIIGEVMDAEDAALIVRP